MSVFGVVLHRLYCKIIKCREQLQLMRDTYVSEWHLSTDLVSRKTDEFAPKLNRWRRV